MARPSQLSVSHTLKNIDFIHKNGKVVRVIALDVTGDVEVCLQRVQGAARAVILTTFPFAC